MLPLANSVFVDDDALVRGEPREGTVRLVLQTVPVGEEEKAVVTAGRHHASASKQAGRL